MFSEENFPAEKNLYLKQDGMLIRNSVCAANIKFKPGPKPVNKFMPETLSLNYANGGTREFTLFNTETFPFEQKLKN